LNLQQVNLAPLSGTVGDGVHALELVWIGGRRADPCSSGAERRSSPCDPACMSPRLRGIRRAGHSGQERRGV